MMSEEAKQMTAEEYAELVVKKVFDEQKKMTKENMRDTFAVAAMNAIIIGNNADECALGIGAAKDAYNVADAMLKARELTNQ